MLAKRHDAQSLVYWPVSRANRHSVKMTTTTISSLDNQQSTAKIWSEQLCAIAQHQDRVAYRALYLHFAPKIKSFYLQQGMGAHAEELTHDVFIRVWRKAGSYQADKAQVSTWLFTIARNIRIDFLRRKQVDTIDEENASEPAEPANFDIDLQDTRDNQQLASVIKLLDIEQRNVIQKVYFEDKSHQLVADELDMTLGTVKSRVRSALKLLRSHLRGEV